MHDYLTRRPGRQAEVGEGFAGQRCQRTAPDCPDNPDVDVGYRSSHQEPAPFPHPPEIVGRHFAASDMGDRLRLGGAVDPNNICAGEDTPETSELIREDRRAAGVDRDEGIENPSRHFCPFRKLREKSGRGGRSARPPVIDLLKNRQGINRAGTAQVGIGDDGGDAGDEIGQHRVLSPQARPIVAWLRR